MKLIHYGRKHLTSVYDRDPAEGICGCFKPTGLWVSVEGEDDWLCWTTAEDFGCGSHPTEVVLAKDANVLILSSVAELDAFNTEYGKLYLPGLSIRTIDWERVGAKYDGLIIAPYQWKRRLHRGCDWYYGWDCASGCIWKARAIAELKSLPVIEKPKAEAAE